MQTGKQACRQVLGIQPDYYICVANHRNFLCWFILNQNIDFTITCVSDQDFPTGKG